MTGHSAIKLQVDALLTGAPDQLRVAGVVAAVANSTAGAAGSFPPWQTTRIGKEQADEAISQV